MHGHPGLSESKVHVRLPVRVGVRVGVRVRVGVSVRVGARVRDWTRVRSGLVFGFPFGEGLRLGLCPG